MILDVLEERDRQEEMREAGRFKQTCADPAMDPYVAVAVLGEEFGEVARAVLSAEGNANDGGGDLRSELVQVAAVAVAWIEGIDAREAAS